MYIPDWIGDITTIAFDYGGTLTVPRELQGGPVDETVTQPVDPLAADALRALHARRFRMVLACNTVPQRPRGAALVAAGVADLFTDVIESHVLGYAKPDPDSSWRSLSWRTRNRTRSCTSATASTPT